MGEACRRRAGYKWDVTPAQHVRFVLSEHREMGTPFDRAWVQALRSLPKVPEGQRTEHKEWKRALRWAKPWFRAAYEKTAPPPKDSIFAAVERAQPVRMNEPAPTLARAA